MRWEDERYVRLYTRDTLTWKRLGWQGRSVLPQLMRKVDRAGLLEIGDVDPADALAAILDMPEEVTGPAWKKLVETGTVTIRDIPSRTIVLPNFIEAQETPQSDAARKRKSRELARLGLTVTPCDEKSQNGPDGHEQSHAVTPSCAVPSCAEEMPPLPPAGAGGQATGFKPPRLKKRRRPATTLAEDLRQQRDELRDRRSRLLHEWISKTSQPTYDADLHCDVEGKPPTREEQLAWVQKRFAVDARDAEDIVAIVEHAEERAAAGTA